MAKPFKNYMDGRLARLLADKITKVEPTFPSSPFISKIKKGILPLEFKDRALLIATCLNDFLEGTYSNKVHLFHQILGPENPKETDMFTTWYWLWPVANFVELFGLDFHQASVGLIYELTKRHTGEFAIRPFLEREPKKTVKLMKKWAKDKNFHVRRLASEGMRTRLPWSKKLAIFIDDPTPILEVIDLLKQDEVMYVKRSVANNLNDILKDNPEQSLATMKDWAKLGDPNTNWIIKHALRNLRKKDDPIAIEIMDNLKNR